MLKLERVSKYYYSGTNIVQALRRIDLEGNLGEFIAITGESGSGKSTLLNVMSGLDTYEEGKVFFNGKDISHYTLEELEHYRKDYIGYVFQEYNIIDSYTVYQNIELALTIQGYSKAQKHNRVMKLIDQVGLSHVANQRASKLSGGEIQRTVIARTLAKDYQILVCDEPTGNLNEEAAKGIFRILRDISRDKLVIVVTHDVSLVDAYATRKIRLYDGEIVEDSLLAQATEVSTKAAEPRLSNTKLSGSIAIGLGNIATAPKKTLFTLFTIIFMLAVVFFVYTAGVIERSKAFTADNPYFLNTDPSRIILTKDDGSIFSDTELSALSLIDNVRGVFNNDSVFDSVFITRRYNTETLWNDFYLFKPLPSLSLDDRDLVEGRFPEAEDEVVVGNFGVYEIDDEIPVANDYLLIKSQSLDTSQFVFTVVGIVAEPLDLKDDLHYFYLANSGLEMIAPTSIYENSQIQININGTEKYDMATDTWITPQMDDTVAVGDRTYGISYTSWVKIDDSLADGEIMTFDMMYFDFCRNFGYKKEITDDFDAGLCDVPDFIASHVITYRAITTYESDKPFEPLTFLSRNATDSDQTMKLYMNRSTYLHFFGEESYQVTLIVRDTFEGKQVVKELEDLGYKVFYPSQVVANDEAVDVVVRNTVITLLVSTIIAVVFIVGYFVLRKLVFSKLKDYLIIRSLGTSKKAIKRIIRAEIFFVTFIAVVSIMAFLIISEYYLYAIPEVIRFFRWPDYLVLGLLVVLVMDLMAVQFTRSIFKASVISALKGVER